MCIVYTVSGDRFWHTRQSYITSRQLPPMVSLVKSVGKERCYLFLDCFDGSAYEPKVLTSPQFSLKPSNLSMETPWIVAGLRGVPSTLLERSSICAGSYQLSSAISGKQMFRFTTYRMLGCSSKDIFKSWVSWHQLTIWRNCFLQVLCRGYTLHFGLQTSRLDVHGRVSHPPLRLRFAVQICSSIQGSTRKAAGKTECADTRTPFLFGDLWSIFWCKHTRAVFCSSLGKVLCISLIHVFLHCPVKFPTRFSLSVWTAEPSVHLSDPIVWPKSVRMWSFWLLYASLWVRLCGFWLPLLTFWMQTQHLVYPCFLFSFPGNKSHYQSLRASLLMDVETQSRCWVHMVIFPSY